MNNNPQYNICSEKGIVLQSIQNATRVLYEAIEVIIASQ